MTEGPLAWLHPFDSGPLHSFSSGLDGDLLGLPPSNCGVAAKMAFNELAALDLLRTPSGFDQRVADAPPPETSRRVTGADATSAGGEKPFAFDAQRVAAGVPSTSYEPAEVRRHLIHSPWFLDLPSFTPYRRFQRRTRAFAGGTLTSQSTDVFSFPSPSPPGFLPRQLRRRRRRGDVLLQGAYPHPRTYPSLRPIRADVPVSPRSRSPEPPRNSENTSLRFFRGCPDTRVLLTKFASPIFASQGPLRTLSARTFDALLNDTSPRENEVRALDAPIALNPPPDAADASPAPPWHPPLGAKRPTCQFSRFNTPFLGISNRPRNIPCEAFFGYGPSPHSTFSTQTLTVCTQTCDQTGVDGAPEPPFAAQGPHHGGPGRRVGD